MSSTTVKARAAHARLGCGNSFGMKDLSVARDPIRKVGPWNDAVALTNSARPPKADLFELILWMHPR
jgi:hypothetical protein